MQVGEDFKPSLKQKNPNNSCITNISRSILNFLGIVAEIKNTSKFRITGHLLFELSLKSIHKLISSEEIW